MAMIHYKQVAFRRTNVTGTWAFMLACTVFSVPALADVVDVPVHRSVLITQNDAMAEVMVADPAIADVHAHNPHNLTVVGKHIGRTNIRIFDKDGKLERDLEVAVGYDLPALRRALKSFMPEETIAVEMLNNSIALTGKISSASAADKALKIAKDFVSGDGPVGDAQAAAAAPAAGGAAGAAAPAANSSPNVLNMLQVTSGQQVMLRVRVGEINRTALKTLGVDLNYIANGAGNTIAAVGTGSGIASLVAPGTGGTAVSPGVFLLPGGQTPTNTQGIITGRWQPNGATGNSVAGVLKALESDGLFKVLAEPNLVAVSGEEAEFLAGGEIPIPVVQGGGGGGNTSVTVQYKPFGVAVRFTPYVLGESRIRMQVQPEVSEISNSNPTRVSGFDIPSINTRRARTTVELAPGESFMIAGLIKDQVDAQVDQLPGVKELPILGALFRSTQFQRNETELVIAVTPYIVDPLKSSDVKLPTDDFRPASQVESFFFGALGSLSGRAGAISKGPALEGPIGFMVD